MEINKFRIVVASVPYREELVCEIYYDSNHWVEIYEEEKELHIIFFSNPVTEDWDFKLDEAFEILEIAKKKYFKVMYPGGEPPKSKNDS